jgi:hypothetical protein
MLLAVNPMIQHCRPKCQTSDSTAQCTVLLTRCLREIHAAPLTQAKTSLRLVSQVPKSPASSVIRLRGLRLIRFDFVGIKKKQPFTITKGGQAGLVATISHATHHGSRAATPTGDRNTSRLESDCTTQYENCPQRGSLCPWSHAYQST